MRNRCLARIVLAVCIVASIQAKLWAGDSSNAGHWVSAWSTAVHAPLPFPGLPPSPVFDNQTIRMIVRPTIGGDRVRIRFSNAFGTTAVKIGAAHVALSSKASAIVTDSDRTLTFGGKPSVTIPPGSPVLSDPVNLKVLPLSEVAVSIYLPEKATSSSVHFWAQHDTYLSEAGDFTSKQDIPNATTKTSWYWLADLEVWAPLQTGATVTLGDSITDGVGAKQGEYSDWPDLVADRLSKMKDGASLSVVNEGIGGNRILHDGAGVSALARFDRDVLSQPGVANLIVLEGINDIGWPHMKPRLPNGTVVKDLPFTHEVVSADDLIMGLRQIIDRAHQHGIRVFGATLTPYEGADYYSDDGEATRQAVNQWIRNSDAFDGVFDFDAAVRDPNHPAQFREGYHSGDHLHPSAVGYKAMADAVNIALLSTGETQPHLPSTNVPDAKYPRLNPDLSATFRVQADNAQKVQLLMELGQSTYDMVKGADGSWEVTTKPLLPGFHYYAISVDGFSSNDPGSRVFFAARREVSGLEVPGPESDFFAAKDVPHGSVRTEWYFSKTTGQTRRIFVYTPPGYDQSTARYPVLYLQHGWGEDEAGWSDQGHENFILDNLIAARKAVPMIIVNENGMTGVHFQPPPPPRIPDTNNAPPPPRAVSHFFMDERYETIDKVISVDLISFIDGHYRTIPDRDHRALAGLSMGGAQALRIGFNHLDTFAYLGAFSPAIAITDTKKDYDGALADPAKINQKLHLLWIGIGTEDFLHAPVKESHEALERAGIKHVWVESSGAHIWTVWRKYLADFAPRLFQ